MNTSSSSKNSIAAKLIPSYELPVTEDVITLADGRMIMTICMDGIPFESEADRILENSFINLKNYFVTLSKEYSSKLAIWTYINKKNVSLKQEYKFDNCFVQSFVDKYCERFQNDFFYKTEYYITYVLKPESIHDGLEKMDAIKTQAQSFFKKYGVRVLSTSKIKDGLYRADNIEFLSYLLNHNETVIPLSTTPVVELIKDSDWFYGYDLLEIRNRESHKKKYAVSYLLKDYPASSEFGMWDFLLKSPYEFVLCTSYVFMPATKAQKAFDLQENKLNSSGDSATEQIEELTVGKGSLASGITAFGYLQSSMMVYGSTQQEAISNGIKLSSDFTTEGKGARWMKSNVESPYVLSSIMPGSKHRPLPSFRSTTNLACGYSLHNYSFGKATGNPIGDGSAIMPLKTLSDGLYFLNTHYSDPGKDVTGQQISGHAMFLGATGTGKTTLEATACAFLQRFDPQMFVIDYNRSTELFVRAYGGNYFTLRDGVFTGLNPFQLEEDASPELKSFLYEFVARCGIDENGVISDSDQLIVKKAVDDVLLLPLEYRRFGMLMQSIPHATDLRIRLSKWCESEGGKYAWALDSEKNTFNPLNYDKVGFDTTVILEKNQAGQVHPACEPLLALLFFYKKLMQREGRLMLTIAEEFWMPCNFPLTQSLIKGILKAGRLKGEFIWLISQSPEDAINCEIFAALIQQTQTKILLPNPDAQMDSYLKIGLTEKEFKKLSALDKESRTFLIKQSNSSCFAKMDLYGFDDYLPIISGTTKSQQLCEKIRKEKGTDDPNVWIPEFQRILREQKGELV